MDTRRRLVVAAVLLVLTAALIAIVLTVDFGGAQGETAEPAAGTEPLLPGAADQAVVAVRVEELETGEAFAARTEDGETWSVEEAPAGTDLTPGPDAFRIRSALAGLPTVQPIRTLTGVEGLAQYGLEEPRYRLTFRLTDGREHTLIVGQRTPAGSAYYAQLGGEDAAPAHTVYLLPVVTLDAVLSFVEAPPVLIPTSEAVGTAEAP